MLSDRTLLPLLKPMLAVPSEPFDHPDYLFEVKWDGYRCLAYLDQRETKLISRNQKNITGAFPDLGDLCLHVKDIPLVLDGEIIVLRNGRPSFDDLQARAKLVAEDRVARAAQKAPAIYMAFDILYRRGAPLVDRPLHVRREYLQAVLKPGQNIFISEQVAREGVAFYRACVEKGLEGVVGKRFDGRYLPGTRSPLWKKVRHIREADLVICGYRRGKGSRVLGALVLGAWDGRKFIYQGMVGTGLNREEQLDLLDRLESLKINESLLTGADHAGRAINWVRPELVCRVEYLSLTREGLLRHPVYKGLRADKPPGECSPAGNGP